ncbi:CLAVATA3/ESR (CLE)-related protein 13 [Acorus calamus]|uniref:CLAVATA3/ESR (CLE)-related protein 13 n=1 Tax=Acorus calamus TaxID=4465 RepID=A0AAV9F6V3_ACOCL|nr:CLAVATA3/ESR (CLE)-related protein 13 [Acorus calamus]
MALPMSSRAVVFLFLYMILLLIMLNGWSHLRPTNQVEAPHRANYFHRKILFDFSPFLAKQHRQHRHRHHRHGASHRNPAPSGGGGDGGGGGDIDPRYGVEKRLVPTGPNPLHH